MVDSMLLLGFLLWCDVCANITTQSRTKCKLCSDVASDVPIPREDFKALPLVASFRGSNLTDVKILPLKIVVHLFRLTFIGCTIKVPWNTKFMKTQSQLYPF